MTKREIEEAVDVVDCFQNDYMCDFYKSTGRCNGCMGVGKAMQMIIDFVDMFKDKLEEADT